MKPSSGFVRLLCRDVTKIHVPFRQQFRLERDRIVVPHAERVSPRLAAGYCGKAVALWTKDGGSLFVDG